MIVKDTNNKIPLISICIGTYNRKDYIQKLLDKFIYSEIAKIELVVIDNCSEDGTWEYLNQIEDSRVRIYRNDRNMGARYNIIKSIFLSRGLYYISVNDRDDIDLAELSEVIKYIDKSNVKEDVYVTRLWGNYEWYVNSLSGRYFTLMTCSHPGTYIIRRALIERSISTFSESNLNNLDERMREIELETIACNVQIDAARTNKWKILGRQVVCVISGEERIKAGQRRFDILYGDPWFCKKAQLNRIIFLNSMNVASKKELLIGQIRSAFRVMLSYEENGSRKCLEVINYVKNNKFLGNTSIMRLLWIYIEQLFKDPISRMYSEVLRHKNNIPLLRRSRNEPIN